MIDDQPAIAAKMVEMPSPLKNAIMRADLEEELKSLQDAGVPEASDMAIEDCPTCQRTESENGSSRSVHTELINGNVSNEVGGLFREERRREGRKEGKK